MRTERTQEVASELVIGIPNKLKMGSAEIEMCSDDIRVLIITG